MAWWVLGSRNDGAVIDARPKDGPEGWRYHVGTRLSVDYPPDAAMGFSRNFPDNRKLYDFVTNTVRIYIVSPRVRRIVEELDGQNVEFLPLTLLDHTRNAVEKFQWMKLRLSRKAQHRIRIDVRIRC